MTNKKAGGGGRRTVTKVNVEKCLRGIPKAARSCGGDEKAQQTAGKTCLEVSLNKKNK